MLRQEKLQLACQILLAVVSIFRLLCCNSSHDSCVNWDWTSEQEGRLRVEVRAGNRRGHLSRPLRTESVTPWSHGDTTRRAKQPHRRRLHHREVSGVSLAKTSDRTMHPATLILLLSSPEQVLAYSCPGLKWLMRNEWGGGGAENLKQTSITPLPRCCLTFKTHYPPSGLWPLNWTKRCRRLWLCVLPTWSTLLDI